MPVVWVVDGEEPEPAAGVNSTSSPAVVDAPDDELVVDLDDLVDVPPESQPICVQIQPKTGNVMLTGTLILSGTTEPPSNTKKVAAWATVMTGTTVYKMPLYQ